MSSGTGCRVMQSLDTEILPTGTLAFRETVEKGRVVFPFRRRGISAENSPWCPGQEGQTHSTHSYMYVKQVCTQYAYLHVYTYNVCTMYFVDV